MTVKQQCLEHAKLADALAGQVADPQLRELYLEIGRAWREVAVDEEAERLRRLH